MQEFIDVKVLINYLEDEFGVSFESLKKEIEDLKINITMDDIYTYLENKLEKEKPEINNKIKNREYGTLNLKPKKPIMAKSETELKQKIIGEIYHFEPYSIEYFQKYTSILKTKCEQLIYIIEKIVHKDISTISPLLEKLDIVLDNNGNISLEDVRRLIEPTTYNINALKEKIAKGNNAQSYLSFNLSKEDMYKKNLSEDELYPGKWLQFDSLEDVDGYIPLSEKQKEIKGKNNTNMEILSNVSFKIK